MFNRVTNDVRGLRYKIIFYTRGLAQRVLELVAPRSFFFANGASAAIIGGLRMFPSLKWSYVYMPLHGSRGALHPRTLGNEEALFHNIGGVMFPPVKFALIRYWPRDPTLFVGNFNIGVFEL